MPIEIKELHIKAVVSPPKEEASKKAIPPADLREIKKEIVEECIEKIFRKLREKTER